MKYLQKNILALIEIHGDMVAALREDAPALSKMQKWSPQN